MIDVEDIHSLSDFQRNTKRYVRKLKTSGKPAVLTVNGGAELVVQSAKACQKLLEDKDLLDGLRRISRGLEQARRGEGRPMRAFIEELAKKPSISLRP